MCLSIYFTHKIEMNQAYVITGSKVKTAQIYVE